LGWTGVGSSPGNIYWALIWEILGLSFFFLLLALRLFLAQLDDTLRIWNRTGYLLGLHILSFLVHWLPYYHLSSGIASSLRDTLAGETHGIMIIPRYTTPIHIIASPACVPL
jgi:hypothetical protein